MRAQITTRLLITAAATALCVAPTANAFAQQPRTIAQAAPPPPRDSGIQRAQIAGCFDLYYALRGSEQLVGRMAFDTTTTIILGETRGRLRFIGGRTGFGAPRGTWTWPKPDSVSVRVTLIDSGIMFAFPKFAADSMRGTGHGTGLTPDTTNTYPARAIRQGSC